MQFASLGSGSKGNATVVATETTRVLVDCGFPRRDATRRLARIGLRPEQLDAILVTHEHGDHAGGVGSLAKAFDIPVYLSHGTAATGRVSGASTLQCVDSDSRFTVGDISVHAVPVPHDAREPIQFCFTHKKQRLGILTDLGSITPHVISSFAGCDALFLECNHDAEMLQAGSYPHSLKRRVGGDYGHLNNRQAAEFLLATDTSKLTTLVIGHLSEQNNTPEHAATVLASVDHCHRAEVSFACQTDGFDWVQVGVSSVALLDVAESA